MHSQKYEMMCFSRLVNPKNPGSPKAEKSKQAFGSVGIGLKPSKAWSGQS